MSDILQYTDDINEVRDAVIALIRKLEDVDDSILRIFAREALDEIQIEINEAKAVLR